MKDSNLVWTDEAGDIRKKKSPKEEDQVIEASLLLEVKRITSGKGRTIIEISALPQNKNWCKKLTKNLKKQLATGGAYKMNIIEIHGEQMENVQKHLDSIPLKWKKIGG